MAKLVGASVLACLLPLTRESSIFLRAGVGQGGSGLLNSFRRDDCF